MKKKLLFIGMVMLALVLTTGTFAYTYTNTGTTTLNATIADAVMTTYQPSAVQPEWEDVMPESVVYYETIMPSAPGDLTENDQYPAAGQNWDKVDDELMPDDWSTYIYNTSKYEHTDLYHLTDLSEDLPISSITVYFRIAGDTGVTALAKPAIKTYGTVFLGSQQSQAGNTFATKSYQWTNNPATNQPWTTSEVNQMQAGVALTKPSGATYVACTQVYVTVNYDYMIIEGEVPIGSLYDITPHPDYTGDMQVKIYLTNTADLLKAYRYLNMKLYMENSLEAEKTPDYQVLSMENGIVSFNIEGGAAASYTVAVTGGSYRMVSGDYNEWGEGWTVTPEFYCEVTQR